MVFTARSEDRYPHLLMAFQLLVIGFIVALSIGNVVSTSGAGDW